MGCTGSDYAAVWLRGYLVILQYLVIHQVPHNSMYVIAPPHRVFNIHSEGLQEIQD